MAWVCYESTLHSINLMVNSEWTSQEPRAITLHSSRVLRVHHPPAPMDRVVNSTHWHHCRSCLPTRASSSVSCSSIHRKARSSATQDSPAIPSCNSLVVSSACTVDSQPASRFGAQKRVSFFRPFAAVTAIYLFLCLVTLESHTRVHRGHVMRPV